MPDSEIPVVDMRREIGAIKSKYGDKYHFKPEAYQEAANLWGFEKRHNDCGVILGAFQVNIVEVKSCKAEVRLAESSKGHWLMGCSADTAISGFGFSPGIFDTIGFASYNDAKAAGIKRIEHFFQRELDSNNSCSSEANKINIAEALQNIKASMEQPQFDLFASFADEQAQGGERGR